ncbi:MAG: hypothetical protein P8105_13880 [Dehalococcoidia bacterium]
MKSKIKSIYIILTVIGIIAASVSMLAFVSCKPANEPAAAQVPANSCPVIIQKGGEDSEMITDNVIARPLPLIDTRVPANIETATFSMG